LTIDVLKSTSLLVTRHSSLVTGLREFQCSLT
jgi:hypothetical protein